jgi:hypothetical protein
MMYPMQKKGLRGTVERPVSAVQDGNYVLVLGNELGEGKEKAMMTNPRRI